MTKQYRVTRDVGEHEPYNWAGRPVKAGETFEEFNGPTWGSCDLVNGIALTGPHHTFFEFPLSAVEPVPVGEASGLQDL